VEVVLLVEFGDEPIGVGAVGLDLRAARHSP
jgi:hypothetical protein